MKTLISYASNHGCTEQAAKELKQIIGEGTILVNLKKEKKPDISDYGRVIIGGSIHAGQIQKRVTDFCAQNLGQLKEKEIGLFICCMHEGEVAQEQLKKAFPEGLHQVAKAEAVFGGAFDLERMKFLEKLVVKKVAKVTESVSNINHEEISHFANNMKMGTNLFMFLV